MEFKKVDFNGVFKITLDLVTKGSDLSLSDESKVAHFKLLVRKFHYFIYYLLIVDSQAGKKIPDKNLKTLNGTLKKLIDGKFSTRGNRFEVSLETVANLFIIKESTAFEHLEEYASETKANVDQFLNEFVEKNFDISEGEFHDFLKRFAVAVLGNQTAHNHLSDIRAAFLAAEPQKVFHNKVESRGYSAYTSIGESVQKQSISTNAGWSERVEWIIDTFATYFKDGSSVSTFNSRQFEKSESEFVIYVGPPGCGKTHQIKNQIKKNGYDYVLLQIHPSYSYEDLVEGIKPIMFPDGELRYDVVEGPLRILAHKAAFQSAKILCLVEVQEKTTKLSFPIGTKSKYRFESAQISDRPIDGFSELKAIAFKDETLIVDNSQAKELFPTLLNREISGKPTLTHLHVRDVSWASGRYALILDELNRGNVAQILGELIYLIGEESAEDKVPVQLQYSQDLMTWPARLSLYGTMNSSDISTTRLDQAIKRRFSMIHVDPNPKLFGTKEVGFFKKFIQTIDNPTTKSELTSLNDLFSFCGASTTPEKLLTEINNKIIAESESLGIPNPEERLLGHSYFLKVCEKICSSLKGTEPDDFKSMTLLLEFTETLSEEVLPAICAILNIGSVSASKILRDQFKIREVGKMQSSLLEIEKISEGMLFGASSKIVLLPQYQDLRNRKWPEAA